MSQSSVLVFMVFLLSISLSSCSSKSFQKQKYAKLSNSKEFEESYDDVWKAALEALSEYKITDKDFEDGEINTDWIYSTSNEKFIEYKVNGFPRKKYLQNRYKIEIRLEKKMERVGTLVRLEEEVEKLNSKGEFEDWLDVSEKDTDLTKANDIIKNIELKLHSRFKP